MGNPFKKKRKTTTRKESSTIVQHKIVKLTYLQTLAVDGGVGDIKDVAGETKGGTDKFINGTSKDSGKKLTDLSALHGLISTGGSIGGMLLGKAIGSAFGKKTEVNSNVTVKDSGWRVVKTWLQPEFDKIRYSVGIRELLVAQFRYEKVSEVVSTPWSSPKDISKVSLIVDEFIPPQFPVGGVYIEYYVKPEIADAEWVRINPVGNRTVFSDSGSIVPRIVSFNTERPVNARLEDAYIETKEEVRQIRFRAILKRPDVVDGGVSADSYSPILKSYRMLLTPRGGL